MKRPMKRKYKKTGSGNAGTHSLSGRVEPGDTEVKTRIPTEARQILRRASEKFGEGLLSSNYAANILKPLLSGNDEEHRAAIRAIKAAREFCGK